jgi:hypothetical protein
MRQLKDRAVLVGGPGHDPEVALVVEVGSEETGPTTFDEPPNGPGDGAGVASLRGWRGGCQWGVKMKKARNRLGESAGMSKPNSKLDRSSKPLVSATSLSQTSADTHTETPLSKVIPPDSSPKETSLWTKSRSSENLSAAGTSSSRRRRRRAQRVIRIALTLLAEGETQTKKPATRF